MLMRRPVSLIMIMGLLASAALLSIPSASSSSNTVRLLDAYWGRGGERIEAAPGDLFVPFTVVLGSDYEDDVISNMRGRLILPAGFSSTSFSSPREERATYVGSIPPGGVFELTFDVNLADVEEPGDYRATLELIYDIVGDSAKFQSLTVIMTLLGRAVIDFSVDKTRLVPGDTTPIEITVRNTGTAAASDVHLSIEGASSTDVVILGSETEFIIPKLEPGASHSFRLRVYTPPHVSEGGVAFIARARYRNTVGGISEATRLIGLSVDRLGTHDIEMSLWLTRYFLQPSGESVSELHVKNLGGAEARQIVISFEQAPGVPVTPVGEATSWLIERLGPSEEAVIQLRLRAAKSAAEGVFQIPVSIEYRDASGNIASERGFVAVSIGESRPKTSSLVIRSGTSITAGRTEKLTLEIENEHKSAIEEIVISASSRTLGFTILGTNNWVIDRLESGDKEELELEVYADPEIANSASSLLLDVQYVVEGAGEVINEQRELGFIVNGYITLRIYDVRVIRVGGEPVLSGNLLNEGNTKALFTTVALELPDGSPIERPEPVFIGDLNPNAPLPFNIRLGIPPSSGDGTVEVSGTIVVTYKDDLRNEFIHREPASFSVERISTIATARVPLESFSPLLIGVITALVLAILSGIILARRRRRHEAA